MSLNTKPQVSLGLVSHLQGSLTRTPGQRRTARASGVPRSTSLTFSHHRSPFPQVDGTKPLTHRFSGTVDTEAGIFVAPLISLLTCHLNLNNTKLLSSYSKTISPGVFRQELTCFNHGRFRIGGNHPGSRFSQSGAVH